MPLGSGCGSVDKTVATHSEVRGLNPFIGKICIEHLFAFNCIENMKIKKKEGGNRSFKKTYIITKAITN